MSMIRLPPGMTPEQYFATPEGQRTAATQATRLPPAHSPGRAQSAQDPYASSTKTKGVNDVAREIEDALAEMAPDLEEHQRRLMAADLAREYTQARRSAMTELTKPKQQAMGPGQAWDGNKFVDTGTAAYQEASDARRAHRVVADEERARNVERVRMQQSKARQGMALEAERQKKRKTGVTGPLTRQARQDEMQARQQAEQFKLYSQGKSKVPPPGMAQPIQPPGQGTPLVGPNKQEMYWRLVDDGEDPVVASNKVRQAFSYEPR